MFGQPWNDGQDRTIWVILGTNGNGVKLKPFIVFNGLEKTLEDRHLEVDNDVFVTFSDDSKVNEAQICQWLNYNFTENSNMKFLIWDDYKYLNGDITPFNYKKWLILLN